MSRFYDALREADRLRQGAPGVQELNWERSDLPVVTDDASPPSVDASLASSTDDARLSLEPEAAEFEGIALLRSPITGTFDRKALIRNAVDPLVVEQYRRLRTKIIQFHSKDAFRSLVVTSPSPEEGKTVTVLNLALSFAMLPAFKVLVVDGDLRRGSLGKWLGVGEHPGLSNLIDGSATLSEVVLKSDAIPINFMGCGTSKTPPGELLQSNQLSRHFQKMTEQFALVLVDSPPVNLITDVQLLAGSCDGVILVTRAFSTTRQSLERAMQDLQPFRVIGTILNGGTRSQFYGRYKGYY
jgi:capsular exopolysaccharide synthesis family protein